MSDALPQRRILFVCTANICRSPAAELLARTRFGEDRMLFRSAGFLRSDEPSPADMVTALGEHGIDASQHRSYQLDDASLAVADLLLTMEGQHVQKATVIRPDAFAKIVPISEANELLARWGPMSIEDFLTHLNRDRDPRSYLDNRWDVSDPYGRRMKAYRKAVEEIDGLVARVIGSLA